jgi:hypothetical protein
MSNGTDMTLPPLLQRRGSRRRQPYDWSGIASMNILGLAYTRLRQRLISKEPIVRSFVASLLFMAVAAQGLPPPYPRKNATKLLETDRIAVWDMAWPKGEPSPMHRHVHDQVGTYYQAGGRLVTSPDGSQRTGFTEVGSISTTGKGTTHMEEGTTDPPLRAVFIELKQDTPSGLPPLASDVPPAFPRAGAKALLDTDRVALWDYTWTSNTPAFTYRSPRDTVVVWLDPGQLRVTPQGGQVTVINAKAGQIRYVTRGTTETVELVAESPRAFVFELK